MSTTGRILTWSGLIAAMAMLSGCPKPYPNCESDRACREKNEVCVRGMCRECGVDSQCKEGFVCDLPTNRCVPKPECTADVECGAGRMCSMGRCADKPTASTDSCTSSSDCPEGMECTGGRCATATKSCDYTAIRFGFNESSLTDDAQDQLKTLAECMRAEKGRLTLEGHADERGTEEYNLQLSNRRAASVKKYLVSLGVTSGSMDTVGYGEERPADSSSNESAWANNRRVEFKKR